VKIALGTFTQEDVLTLDAGDDKLFSAQIWGSNAYFMTFTSPGRYVWNALGCSSSADSHGNGM
jgi:hypothetical protein